MLDKLIQRECVGVVGDTPEDLSQSYLKGNLWRLLRSQVQPKEGAGQPETPPS